MSRTTRPESLRTSQNHILESRESFWKMYASLGGTSYIKYVGYARPGTAVSAAGWLICENTYDSTGNLIIRKHANNSNGVVDFDQIWDASSALTINAVTQAADGEVTCTAAHGLSTGDVVEITGVVGMTELNSDGYGSKVFTITKVDATKFTLGVNTSAYTAYSSAGSVNAKNYLNLTFN